MIVMESWVFFRVHLYNRKTTKKSLRAYWVYSMERNHWDLRTVSLTFWESSSANSVVSANSAGLFSLVPQLGGSHAALISQLPWQSPALSGEVYRFQLKPRQENQHAMSRSASKHSLNPRSFRGVCCPVNFTMVQDWNVVTWNEM